MSPKEVPRWKWQLTARGQRAGKISNARGDNKRADDSLEEVLAVEAKVRAKMKGNKKKAYSWTDALYSLSRVSCLDDRGLPTLWRSHFAKKSTGSKAPRVQLAELNAKKAADAAAAAAKSDDA
jgi:hypothetical protein